MIVDGKDTEKTEQFTMKIDSVTVILKTNMILDHRLYIITKNKNLIYP